MSDAWLDKLRDPSPWTPPKPLPQPLQVDGLVVRSYVKGDGAALFAAVSESRKALTPWMPWVTTDHLSVEDSHYYVERTLRAAAKPGCLDFALGIFDATSGALLGGTGLHRIRPELREAEVGYWVRGDRHGQGICTRAVGALITSALRPAADGGWGFRRIVVFNAVDNVGSRRVCEKLGLRLEARMRAERYLDPIGYHDTLAFGVLSHEWDFATQRAKPDIAWEA